MRFLKNEKGIALVMVLVVSVICLAIVSALIYLVIQGTRSSAVLKKYETAREAGGGGSEIAVTLISNLKSNQSLVIPGIAGIDYPSPCVCGYDLDPTDNAYPDPSPNICLCRKLCLPTSEWKTGGKCSDDNISFANPSDITDALKNDMQFNLSGVGTTSYQVSVKIVDTAIGVTVGDNSLGCGSGTAYSCGTFKGLTTPYLYRLEINAQDTDPTRVTERARLSVLYAF